MSNNIMRMKNDGLSNVTSLSVMSSMGFGSHEEYEASGKFFNSASLLPAGEFLGWQISMDKEGNCSSFAFSSKEADVTAEDFGWMFQKCATVSADAPDKADQGWWRERAGAPDKADQGWRRVYALRLGSSIHRDSDERDFSPVKELLEMMGEVGATMRILSESDGRSPGGQAEILLSLPDAITLRMRSILSFAFPETTVEEVDAREDGMTLPVPFASDHMARLLRMLRSEKLRKECDAEGRLMIEDEGDWEDFEMDDSCTPLEDLELSVRSYNCLKRAGIDTVEELRKKNDEELIKIRNLSRKCLEEINQALGRETQLCAPASTPVPAKDYSAMLDELIGLAEVKEQVRKIKAFARMKRDMAKRQEKPIPIALNMEFVGNPGTAKTTVARIVAGIFHEAGILPGDGIVEVGRADLVAKYEGQTADKVKSVFRQAKGKLLFIDEAYSLVESWEGEFGDEAINTIVQEMENNREDTIVVFAGYPDKMEGFIARNPGLRSRVPFRISFSDYSADEMLQIAQMEARKRGFTIQPQAEERVAAICGAAMGRSDAGNGRFCRNLVENAVLGYAARVYGDGSQAGGQEFELTAEDFMAPDMPQKETKVGPIGFRA